MNRIVKWMFFPDGLVGKDSRTIFGLLFGFIFGIATVSNAIEGRFSLTLSVICLFSLAVAYLANRPFELGAKTYYSVEMTVRRTSKSSVALEKDVMFDLDGHGFRKGDKVRLTLERIN